MISTHANTFFVPEALKISLPASHVIMEVGLGDQIECTVEKGYPKPTKWKWTKKGHTEKVLSTSPSLKIVDPTEEDQGVYYVEVCILTGGSFLNQGLWICKFFRWKMGWPRTYRRSWWKSKVTIWCLKPPDIILLQTQEIIMIISFIPLQTQFLAMRRGSSRGLKLVSLKILSQIKRYIQNGHILLVSMTYITFRDEEQTG